MFESAVRKVKSPEIGPSFRHLQRQNPQSRLNLESLALSLIR